MTTKHRLLAALVALIWGVNFLAIDLGLRDTPPLVLVAIRFAAVAFPLILFVRRPKVSWTVLAGIGLFQSAGQFGLLFTAMHLGLPTGLAPIVLQSQMIFTIAVAAVVLRERPTAMQAIGAAVGVVGLGLVGAGRTADVGGAAATLLPFLICVAAGLSWGIGNVVSRAAGQADGFAVVVWSAIFVPIPVLLLSLGLDGPAAVGEAFASIGWETVGSVAYMTVLASLVGYSIWNTLLARYPAALVTPYTLLIPPIGLAAAWLVLGERPSPIELAGCAVLVAGVAIGQLRRRSGPHRPMPGATAPDVARMR